MSKHNNAGTGNRGRPPELRDEQANELLQRITDGDSLLEIVQRDGDWPSYRAMFRRIDQTQTFEIATIVLAPSKLSDGLMN